MLCIDLIEAHFVQMVKPMLFRPVSQTWIQASKKQTHQWMITNDKVEWKMIGNCWMNGYSFKFNSISDFVFLRLTGVSLAKWIFKQSAQSALQSNRCCGSQSWPNSTNKKPKYQEMFVLSIFIDIFIVWFFGMITIKGKLEANLKRCCARVRRAIFMKILLYLPRHVVRLL